MDFTYKWDYLKQYNTYKDPFITNAIEFNAVITEKNKNIFVDHFSYKLFEPDNEIKYTCSYDEYNSTYEIFSNDKINKRNRMYNNIAYNHGCPRLCGYG